jgi:hypothetical protein
MTQPITRGAAFRFSHRLAVPVFHKAPFRSARTIRRTKIKTMHGHNRSCANTFSRIIISFFKLRPCSEPEPCAHWPPGGVSVTFSAASVALMQWRKRVAFRFSVGTDTGEGPNEGRPGRAISCLGSMTPAKKANGHCRHHYPCKLGPVTLPRNDHGVTKLGDWKRISDQPDPNNSACSTMLWLRPYCRIIVLFGRGLLTVSLADSGSCTTTRDMGNPRDAVRSW